MTSINKHSPPPYQYCLDVKIWTLFKIRERSFVVNPEELFRRYFLLPLVTPLVTPLVFLVAANPVNLWNVF
jgi:hypothetical protein